MKKILFSLAAATLLVSNSYCQSNNPHDKLGADIVSATLVIYKDLQDGKIKTVDQSTIDYYYKTVLSSFPKVTLDELQKYLTS